MASYVVRYKLLLSNAGVPLADPIVLFHDYTGFTREFDETHQAALSQGVYFIR